MQFSAHSKHLTMLSPIREVLVHGSCERMQSFSNAGLQPLSSFFIITDYFYSFHFWRLPYFCKKNSTYIQEGDWHFCHKPSWQAL